MMNIKNHTEMFKNFRDIRDSKARELKCKYNKVRDRLCQSLQLMVYILNWQRMLNNKVWSWSFEVRIGMFGPPRVFGSFFLGYRLSAGYLGHESDF